MDSESNTQKDLLNDFITEGLENLENAENALLALEQDIDIEKIHEVFRAVHSLKGAAGFFKLINIEKVSHLAESILGKVREGVCTLDGELTNVLLKSIDSLQCMLKSEDIGVSFEIDDLTRSLELQTMKCSIEKNHSSQDPDAAFITIQMVQEILKTHDIHKFLYAFRLGLEELDSRNPEDFFKAFVENINGVGTILGQYGKIETLASEKKPIIFFIETVAEEDIFIPLLNIKQPGSVIVIDKLTKQLLQQDHFSPIHSNEKVSVVRPSSKEHKEPELTRQKDSPQQTIRISVAVLDELLELIGEVVLGRNQFMNKYNNDKTFKTLSQSITKLHQHVIQTRMQPIGVLFNKYKRTVRDLSAQLEKKIELSIEGEEIELDRTIIEAIADPLTHLVRNSIDHGIEIPSERSISNKSIYGNISLRAYHESGQILIEVEDDGKGLDHEQIKKKAIDKNFITQEEADALNKREAVNLIFRPGFSTKDAVSSISGRGVGMDVVKTNLEKIGCVLEISSEKGKGSLISARIPLTQAIVNSSVISGLIINIGDYTLAIPQLAVNEVIKISPREQIERIDFVNGREVFKLRDKIIPLVHLEDILGIQRTYFDRNRGLFGVDRRAFVNPVNADRENPEKFSDVIDRRSSNVIFIVLHFKQNFFGILVDKIAGTEEIVVKRLPKLIKHRRVFAGATILGNGEVSFILDINGLVEKTGLNFGKKGDDSGINFMRDRNGIQEKQKCIIFTYAENEYFAVPINLLSEVDRFNRNEIRNVGKREFIQRHSESIPLLRLDNFLDVSELNDKHESLTVIIPARVQYPTGLIASSVITSIDLTEDINTKEATENGVMGTFFHDDKLVTILDFFTLLQKSDPVKYKASVDDGIEKCRILFAEDQLFFRQLVTQYFKSYGIKNVTVAKNGYEALQLLLQHPEKFDVLVSDIEMPEMNGYELISNIRSDPRLSQIPAMALTSLSSEENVKKGLDIGFDAYEIKLDKEKVILRINELFHMKKSVNS